MSNLATITNNILADSGIDDINVVVTTGSYSNPAWITALAWTKITGAPAFVTNVTATSPLLSSGGATPNITIQQASGSQNGFLSSTDWTTFNNKQNALTNPVTGTGTTNYLPKFTGASTIGDSIVTDNGSVVSVISGTLALSNAFNLTGRNAANTINIALIGRNSSDRVIIDADGYGTNIGGGGTVLINPTGGNVGIGTPSPSNGRLEVFTSSAVSYNPAGFNVVNLALRSGSGTTTGSIVGLTMGLGGSAETMIGAVQTASGTADIVFQSFNGSAYGERMRITSGGNVLIGTTTDNGARLQVSGTATFSSFITAQSSGGSGLRIYGGSGTNQWDMYLNGTNIRFSDNTGTGSIVFDRPLSGTSASFSSTTEASSASTASVVLAGGLGVAKNIRTAQNIIAEGVAGTIATLNGGDFQVYTSGNANYSSISSPSSGNMVLKVNIGATPINALTLASTGAATFSSSVTAPSFISDGGGSEGVMRIERDTVGTNAIIGALNFTNNNGATIYGRVRGGRNSAGDGYVSLGTGVGDNLYALEGGNVGIGTTSPNYLLHIAAGAANPQLQFTSTGTGSTTSDGFHIGVNNSTLNAFLLQKENASLQFLTNDTERMRLDASGNLGLGVTPSAWASDFRAMQIGLGTSLYNNSNTNGTFLGSNFFFNGSNNIYLGTGTATAYAQSLGTHAWYIAPSGTAGNAISFTQAMTLGSNSGLSIGTPSAAPSQGLLVQGNVGIGVGPVLKLDVQGNAADTTTVSGVTVEQVTLFRPSNGVGGIRSGFNTSTGDAYLWSAQSSGNLYLGTRVAPNNNVNVAILSSGNVGIGTNSPQSNLQVLGTIKVATGNAQGILGLGEANGTTVNVGLWRGAANAPTTDGNFLNLGGYEGIVFASSNAAIGSQTERMRIASGGNVGIGTNNPAQILSVQGEIAKYCGVGGVDGNFENLIKYGFPTDLQSGTSQANRWVGIDATVTAGSAVVNTLRIRAYSGGTGNAAPVNVADFRGDQSSVFYGNVLIGTITTPTPVSGVAFPLTVSSSAATRIRIDSTNASPNSGVGLYASGVQKFSFAMYGASYDFTIYNDALLAPSLTVKGTNSNVLIGTTTDTSDKLRVNGNTFTNTLMTWNPENDNRSGIEWRFGAASIASITPNRRLRVSVGGMEYYIAAVEV